MLSKWSKKVSKHIIFLGEIPQTNDFERRRHIGKQNVDGVLLNDYLMDDTALAYKSKNNLKLYIKFAVWNSEKLFQLFLLK